MLLKLCPNNRCSKRVVFLLTVVLLMFLNFTKVFWTVFNTHRALKNRKKERKKKADILWNKQLFWKVTSY